jgi:uncharacterized membrane protein YbhN (UPF0104 family)
VIAVRRAIPWIIAALLLFFLFHRYPLADVLAAISHVDTAYFAAFILIYFSYTSLADIWSLHRILGHFDIGGRFRNILEVRLASNLATILNYGLGQGVLAYMIKRRSAVPFAKATSVLALVVLMDLYWALSISFAATFVNLALLESHGLVAWIRMVWVAASLGILALIVFWHLPAGKSLLQHPRVSQWFHVFQNARVGDYLKILAWRLPLHLAACSYLWFLAFCFGVSIPIPVVIMLLPLTIVLGAIPITPSGLGTVQVASIYFFGDQVSGGAVTRGAVSGAEMVFAMSILFTIAVYMMKLLSGALFLRTALETSSADGW